jgi:hypothetical protein
LSQFAVKNAQDPKDYRNMILYSKYLTAFEDIDLIQIFDEVENFETEVKEQFFQNDDERSLSKLSHLVNVLSELLDTSLNSKDYQFYLKNQKDCEIGNIQKTLEDLSGKYPVPYSSYVNFDILKNAIPSAEKFYTLASKRNEAMLKNTLERMKKENVHLAALVTGGFHSEGISELMDKDKLSYLVVMPKIDPKSPDRPYIAILTQKPKEYEEQFKGSEFYIAEQEYFGARLSKEQQLGVMAGLLAGARLAGIKTNDAAFIAQYAEKYGEKHPDNYFTREELGARMSSAIVQPRGNDTITVTFPAQGATFGEMFFIVPHKDRQIQDITRVEPKASAGVLMPVLSKGPAAVSLKGPAFVSVTSEFNPGAEFTGQQRDNLITRVQSVITAGSTEAAVQVLVEKNALRMGFKLKPVEIAELAREAGARMAEQEAAHTKAPAELERIRQALASAPPLYIAVIGRRGESAQLDRFTKETLKAYPGVRVHWYRTLGQALKANVSHKIKFSMMIDQSTVRDAESRLQVSKAIRQLTPAQQEALRILHDLTLNQFMKGLTAGAQRKLRADLAAIFKKFVSAQPALPMAPSISFTDKRFYLEGTNVPAEASPTLIGRNLGDMAVQVSGQAIETRDKSIKQIVSELSQNPDFIRMMYGVDLKKAQEVATKAAGETAFESKITLAAFRKDPENIIKQRREQNRMRATLLVQTDKEAFYANPENVAAIEEFGGDIDFAPPGMSLKDLQEHFKQSFVLVADEKEGFRADAGIVGDNKAILLELGREKEAAAGVFVAAAILLIDAENLPSFIERIGNKFLYLPKIAPIEWTIWMTTVKEALKSAGAAA